MRCVLYVLALLQMLSQQAVTESQKHVSDYRDLYDTLQAEDKVMDRDFKRKFHDIPAYHTDALYKLFRKRPRLERAHASKLTSLTAIMCTRTHQIEI